MLVPEYFNRLYGAHDRYWWQDRDRYSLDREAYPYSLLTQMMLRSLGDRPPGRALDLGAGEGSDSIRLALLGYHVEAVEISEVGAEKIRRFADEAGADVRVTVADIGSHEFTGPFDVIVCNGVLHYVNDDDKSRIVHRMQDATAPGGLNVVSLWSDYSQIPDCHDAVPTYPDSEDGLVIGCYKEWAKLFLYYDREKRESAHSELPEHAHSHIKMIAELPTIQESEPAAIFSGREAQPGITS